MSRTAMENIVVRIHTVGIRDQYSYIELVSNEHNIP
jgi:hypothetical protein